MESMNLPGMLTPDIGLIFWMALAFIIVLLILAKFGFPAIIKMVEERQQFISESLTNARKANEELASIQAKGEKILCEAREEQAKIVKDAMATRDAMIKEAKAKASAEGEKLLQEAKAQIQVEKENALREIRSQSFLSKLLNNSSWSSSRMTTSRKPISTAFLIKSRNNQTNRNGHRNCILEICQSTSAICR